MIYSDINSETPYNKPELTDADSVIQSVKTIMNVRKKELLFLPQFGTDGEDYIFELIDDIGANILFQDMVNNINAWEPRVQLDLAQSNVFSDPDNNVYKATMVFNILGLDGVYSVSENI